MTKLIFSIQIINEIGQEKKLKPPVVQFIKLPTFATL